MDENDKKVLSRIATQVSELHAEWPEFKGMLFSLRGQVTRIREEYERRIQQLESWRNNGLLYIAICGSVVGMVIGALVHFFKL